MRVAVAGDHGSWEQARAVATYLRELGVAEVQVFAPRAAGETMYYAVSGAAALQRLEARAVDRVIALCGNGLGVLDVANQFAEEIPGAKVTRPPVYADNFWNVVEGQRRAPPANVMCMGARLLDVPENPMRAFVKAFFDAPDALTALASADTVQYGVSTDLVDPKPGRIEKRTLPQGLEATLALSDANRAAIRSERPAVYYQAQNDAARLQARVLNAYLRAHVEVLPWAGDGLPPTGRHNRVIYLADGPVAGLPNQPRGVWRPSAEADLDVYDADLARGIEWFAKSGDHAARTLRIAPSKVSDDATGGQHHDVLRLFAKTFLTARPSDKAGKTKDLYFKAVRFVSAILGGSAMPDDVKEWLPALEALAPS